VKRRSTSLRGYGHPHQALRQRWAPLVAAGGVRCARCGELIGPREPWDLGHVDSDRSRYAGPEHSSCNRATARHRAARVVPPDGTDGVPFYGPNGERWSRRWHVWR
jgi:hypothetical protein